MKTIWLYVLFVTLAVVTGFGWGRSSSWHNRYLEALENENDFLCTRGKLTDDLVFHAGNSMLIVRKIFSVSNPYYVVWNDSRATDGFLGRFKFRENCFRFVREYFDKFELTSAERKIFEMIGKPVDRSLVIDYKGKRRSWYQDFAAEKDSPYVDDNVIRVDGKYYRVLSVCATIRRSGVDYLTPPIVTHIVGPMPTPEKAALLSYFSDLPQDESYYGRY